MKKFLTQLFAIAATLGLEASIKDRTVSEEDQAKLKEAYDKKFGEGAYDKDMAEYKASIARRRKPSSLRRSLKLSDSPTPTRQP